jgi:hypothetical protein
LQSTFLTRAERDDATTVNRLLPITPAQTLLSNTRQNITAAAAAATLSPSVYTTSQYQWNAMGQAHRISSHAANQTRNAIVKSGYVGEGGGKRNLFCRGKVTLRLTVDCITSAEIRRVRRTYVYSPQGNYVHKIFRDSNETAQTIAMCRQFGGLKKKKRILLPYKSFASTNLCNAPTHKVFQCVDGQKGQG